LEIGFTLFINTTLDILRADGNRLALALSRNTVDVRKVEDDAEKTTMSYLEYRSKRAPKEKELGRTLTSTERDKISGEIAGINGKANKQLKACLQSELVLTYWGALMSVHEGQGYLNTKYFSSKWSDKTIHQPGGGVSRISGLQ
jgi:hypothetical protein